MDLKDFHVQFGPTNHKTLMRCLKRRLVTVRDSNIRRELLFIIKTLEDELCRGILVFNTRTDKKESLEGAFDDLNPKHAKHVKANFNYTTKEFNPLEDQEAGKSSNKNDQKSEPDTIKSEECTNTFVFEVKNGLLSGWKLTSLMGSIYNNSTNMFCNFWHLNKYGLVPTNYIT